MPDHHPPGLLVLVHGRRPPVEVASILSSVGLGHASIVQSDGYCLATWGMATDRPTREHPLLLSLTNCRHGGRVEDAVLARWVADGSLDNLSEMLPPFGVVGLAPGGIRIVADHMGVRQLYRSSGGSWEAVSTSARALAGLSGNGLDDDGILLQSQLGWQLGARTLFKGVSKVPAGQGFRVLEGVLLAEESPQPMPVPVSLEDGVEIAAAAIRDFLDRFLDEWPDALLQLTGGQDSRLVLSAVPKSRRSDLHAMTLVVPGSEDASIAAALAGKYGMKHTVKPLAGLTDLTPAESYRQACLLASLHDCMADPLARAAISWAEESIPQVARLSGIGGEVARGFYYSGWVRPTATTRTRAEQLAKWRLFTNEAVEIAALAKPFAERALSVALAQAVQAIASGGHEWFTATDNLYFRHRMQRWMGVCESAVALSRSINNPMLDDRFLSVSLGLAPWDKQNAQFLGRLQVALDEELAAIPLDGRPAPNAYANPGLLELMNQRVAMAGRVARKVRQRLTRTKKPAAGTAVLAGKIAQHLRDDPAALDPARSSGVFDEAWLHGLCTGSVQPAPSSLALLINVIVASGGADQDLQTSPTHPEN